MDSNDESSRRQPTLSIKEVKSVQKPTKIPEQKQQVQQQQRVPRQSSSVNRQRPVIVQNPNNLQKNMRENAKIWCQKVVVQKGIEGLKTGEIYNIKVVKNVFKSSYR